MQSYEFKISVQWFNQERSDSFEQTFKMKRPAKARIYVSDNFKARIDKALEFIKEPTFHAVELSSAIRNHPDDSQIEFLDENGSVIPVPFYADFGEEEHRKVVDEERISVRCDTIYGVTCEILFRNAYTELLFTGRVKELSGR